MNNAKQRGKPRGMRRDRDCSHCKARAIKCDLNRPRCLPCVEAGLACGGYPQRVVWTGERSTSMKPKQRKMSQDALKTRMSQLDKSPPELSYTQDDEGYSERKNHYMDPSDTDKHSFVLRLASFCQHIKTAEERGQDTSACPTSEVIRLVSCLSDLMEARINGCPKPGLSPGEPPESMDVARHRHAALMELSGALETANPCAILGIAAFAVLEVFDGSFGEWQRHLYGAKSLLDCHCQNLLELEQLATSVPGLTEIVARLIWFDTMGTIARGTTGLIFEDWHRQILNDNFFSIVGCPADAFEAFVDIAKGDICSDPLSACFQAMGQLLELGPDSSDWERCANMSRCAVVLAVLGKLKDKAPTSHRESTILSAVDKICRLISAILPSSPFFIHMATPVYLAGINASTAKHCEVVRRYWLGCNSAGVTRYPDGLRRCEERWRQNGLE